ncbi:MAG: mannonate dehydratase [Nitratireductor sp.]
MRQTWRWFGEHDLVSLEDIEQAGASGVVSALHHIDNGAVWSVEEIEKRKAQISLRKYGEPTNLTWDVVESLPVSEEIKRQQFDWREHIENYKLSLQNLATCGQEVVCYNFMPILDWTRTDLAYRLPNGATCMRFDYIDFAAFDLFVLKRDGAQDSFDREIVEAAKERAMKMCDAQKQQLAHNIVAGLPGANQNLSMDDIKELLETYAGIDANRLRQNLIDFLQEIIPTAQKLGIRMCCHPDDPPFSLLGLPRIMSNEADYKHMINAVDSPANGITLCSGSLGAHVDNDLVGMMQRLGDRVHFLHLRNVTLESETSPCSFYETEHLDGNTDMVALIGAILDEEKKRKSAGRSDWNIPMRPDHGQDILDDLHRKAQPGYPSIGRLKGLAELRGVAKALSQVKGLH